MANAVYLAVESGSDDLAFRLLDAAEASFEQMAARPAMGAVPETPVGYTSPLTLQFSE